MKNLVLTGGGSAGHAVPNTALIPALSDKYNLSYIGTDGIEKRIVAPYKIPYCTIKCAKFVRGFSPSNLSIPFRFYRSVKEARRGLKALKADGVFSKGGYVALPVVFAAKSLGIPVLSHESDLTPGLANRLIAGKCRAVLTNFPETAKKLKNGKYTGAPIREELFCGDRSAALAKYGFSGQKPVLLVLGGGSGSRAVNQVLRAALFKLTETFDILHVCGRGNAVQSSVRGYVQREYEEDMPSAYAASDFALSRSGAGAAFELISLKKPTLFIPLENRRTRGDQAENADYFQSRGLAEVLHEKDMTPGSLVRSLSALRENTKLKNALAACPIARGNAAVLDEIDKMMNADNIFRRK